jgi:DNA helicase-2/ATP-dependent DNA helicase PcrA
MTIHMAKGLEFPYVFIVGLEEELFPSQMMISSRADLEEERRLFYVAITRSKSKLYLSYALNRYRFGRLKTCDPSRFLEDIDPVYIKVNKKHGGIASSSSPSEDYFAKNFVAREKATQPKKYVNQVVHTPSEDFEPSDTSNLETGMRVEHQKFGFGEVKEIDESGPNKKAVVAFEKAGEKTLLLSFAKLRIH